MDIDKPHQLELVREKMEQQSGPEKAPEETPA